MDGKKIRSLIAVVSGAVIAIAATLFMLMADTKAKVAVEPLMGIAIFGLGGGIMQALGGLGSADEEDSKSPIILIASFFMGVGLIVSLFSIASNETFISFIKTEVDGKTGQYLEVIRIITLVLAFINAAGVAYLSMDCVRNHFAFLEKRNQVKFNKVSNIVRWSVVGFFSILFIVGFIMFTTSPIVSNMFKERIKEGLTIRYDVFTYNDYGGLSLIFGGESIINRLTTQEVVLGEYTPADPLYEDVSFISAGIPVMQVSVIMAFVGLIASIVLAVLPQTKKSTLFRGIAGLILLVGAVLSLFAEKEIILMITSTIEGLEKYTWEVGAGLNWYVITSLAAGIVLSYISLLERENKFEN